MNENRPTIGSISTGTLRTRDLLPLFHTALELLDRDRAIEIFVEHGLDPSRGWPSDDSWFWDHDVSSEMLDAYISALDEHAPPYCRFGAHEGDGADFGWWPDLEHLEEDARAEDGVIRVGDMSEVPEGWCGHVMHVSDHGNVTLYEPRVEYDEVWGVV